MQPRVSPQVGDGGSFGGDDGLGGYMPLAVAANDNIAGPQLIWVHANHMGVPAVYTDASGAAINAPSGYSAPGFPGQSRTLGDLYYNRYRDYDPSTGRYIQADPIGLGGGASPYSYAMNNPLRYTDPTGEFVPLLLAFGGGFLGDLAWQYFIDGKDFDDLCYGEAAIAGFGSAIGVPPVLKKGYKLWKKARIKKQGFNPFKGKTNKQIDDMLKNKGYQPQGRDPMNGKGTYYKDHPFPRHRRSYHNDRNHLPGKPPHVGVGRPRGSARDNFDDRDFDL